MFDDRPGGQETLHCAPSTIGVISWNTLATDGAIALRVHFVDGTISKALPYVTWSQARRQSLGGADDRAHIDVDVLRSTAPFDAVEVRSTAALTGLALATSQVGVAAETPHPAAPIDIDVPLVSQYVDETERGWCSPASLAMILRFHGIEAHLEEVVRATYDDAYGGTGNWAFNVAFAGRFRLKAYVAYLRDFAHARTFLDAGVPLVISYAWRDGELTGAPLDHSAGHLSVLRGFTTEGDPILNDPAHPDVRVVYPAAQLEPLWRANHGAAYVIAPHGVPTIDLVNG